MGVVEGLVAGSSARAGNAAAAMRSEARSDFAGEDFMDVIPDPPLGGEELGAGSCSYMVQMPQRRVPLGNGDCGRFGTLATWTKSAVEDGQKGC